MEICFLREGEYRGQGRICRDIRTDEDGEKEEHDADDAGPLDVARPDHVHPDAHEEGDGHGGEDGEGAPGAFEHGVDHCDGEAGQGQDEDKEEGDRGHHARDLADLAFGDLREALAFVPDRGEEHDHVMHARPP